MKHVTPVTVRTYECDSYGHVNHAVFVNYLEHARVEFLKAASFDYPGLVAAGFATVISRLEISYLAPAYAGDHLAIETEPKSIQRLSGIFRQTIRRDATSIAEAEIRWCVVNPAGRPARPPAQFDLRKLAS